MNRRQVSALLMLKELGIKYEMESFDERLSVQKSVYLAQAAGADLGHYFNWYLRGPYSPSLTQDVFDAIQNFDADASTQGWELDAATRARLVTLRTSFDPPGALPQPSWLELLASVHFLIDRHQVSAADPDSITTQLARFGKTFTRDQVSEALQRLRRNGLIKQQA